MFDKSKRTLELYKKIGAEMRLMKEIETKLAVDLSKIMRASDLSKWSAARKKIDSICSMAEDNMFRDHPDLDSRYISVFYGGLDLKPRNDIDAEVMEEAGKVAKAYVGKEN